MADMAQEIKNLKTVQVNHRQEHGDEVESQHQVPQSPDPPGLKVDPIAPLRLTAAEEPPALNDGLTERIAEEKSLANTLFLPLTTCKEHKSALFIRICYGNPSLLTIRHLE